MESKIEINAIVWSTNIENARKYAAELTGAQASQNNHYSKSTSEYTLNSYVRCPNHPVTATPSSITDIVIIQIEETGDLAEAKKYLDSRRGIPMRVCLSSKVGEFDELECKLVNPSALASEGDIIIKEALAFEKTLVEVFKKFDINGNGLISTEELMQISAELGNVLTYDDAKMITDTLDREKKGNVDFNGFKKWWVTGKSDFASFRRIVKAELKLNNLIKKTSGHFNDYLTNLSINSTNVASSEVQQTIDINLHSRNTFENGIGVFFDICNGDEAKEIIQSLNENLRNSPTFLTLALEMTSNEIAANTAEMLSQMVLPMLQEIPQLSGALMMGLNLGIRADQNKLIFEVTLSSMLAETFVNALSMYNTVPANITGESTVHLFTNANVNDIISKDLPALTTAEKILNMKIHFTAKAFNLRGAIEGFCSVLEEQTANGLLPSSFKNVLLCMRVSSVLRNLTFDLNFDPTPLLDLMALKMMKDNVKSEECKNMTFEEYKNYTSLNEDNKFNEQSNMMRDALAQYISMAQQMKEMVPPEMLENAKAVNLDKIEIHYGLTHPNLTLSQKITLNLPGVNSIRDQITN